MTTRKNIRLLTIVGLFVAAITFGVCGCETQKMEKVRATPTPTPLPKGITPGHHTDKATPAPH